MRRHQNRLPATREVDENRQHEIAVLRVEISGRLVRKYDRRFVNDCARDCGALQLTAGDVRWQRVGTFENTNCFERAAYAPVDFSAVTVLQYERQCDVFAQRQRRQQIEELKHGADPIPAKRRQRVVGERRCRHVVDAHFTAIRKVDATDEIEQCTLPTPARTEQSDQFAGIDSDANIVERDRAAVVNFVDVRNANGPAHQGRQPVSRLQKLRQRLELRVRLLEVLRVDLNEVLPFLRHVGVCENRFHGACGNARAAVNADFGVDKELLFLVFTVDTIDRAHVDARLVFCADTRFGDDVRHGKKDPSDENAVINFEPY